MEADRHSAFIGCEMEMNLVLSHGYTGKALEGARAVLDETLMKYNAEIGGVLLGYAKLKPAGGPSDLYKQTHSQEPLGRMFDEMPVIHTRVSMEAVAFVPKIGDHLHGTVQALGSGHISLLIGGLFNASLLLEDMLGRYEFDESTTSWTSKSRADDTSRQQDTVGSKRRRTADSDAVTALAKNPERIDLGSVVYFLVKGISNAAGVLALHGTFDSSILTPAESTRVKSARTASAADVEELQPETEPAEEEKPKKEKKEKKQKKEKKSTD